jgi:hypothetical protein
MSVNSLNPAYSKILDIVIQKDNGNKAFSILKPNTLCRFEKMEFLESIFEIFPSGSLVVRDTSDIISYITREGIDTIVATFMNGEVNKFSITSTSIITNAASETEENFVSINFSNHLYKSSQDNSLIKILDTPKPIVKKVSSLVSEIVSKASVSPFFKFKSATKPKLVVNDETSNYALYKPLNPLEDKIEVANENFIQYLYYLSSMACNKLTSEPNYLFWTGFENQLNFKYFYRNIEDDGSKIDKLNFYNLRYAVFDSEATRIRIPRGGKNHYKIYILTTEPADQFVSKKYYYVRKTPKILNKRPPESTESTTELLTYQFQDEGQKFDIEIIGSNGLRNSIEPGADELKWPYHWGYYTSMVSDDRISLPASINQNLGLNDRYSSTNFMGLTGVFPYIDNTEMWKNIFDFTPIHPNISTNSDTDNNSNTVNNSNTDSSELQTVMDIRYDVFRADSGISSSLEQIRRIERQNFIAYVLCCLKTSLEEETFFASIIGYKVDPLTESQKGYNEEPLKYLYAFGRLKYYNVSFNEEYQPSLSGTSFRLFESPGWVIDESEKTDINDDLTWAVNLNERTNGTDLEEQYNHYSPGWYALNLVNQFNSVKYRPVSNPVGELVTEDLNFDYTKQIVKMTKTPIQLLLFQAGVQDQEVINYYSGKYLYTFNSANITDGPCS